MRSMWSGSRGRWGLSRREDGEEAGGEGEKIGVSYRKQGSAVTHYEVVRGRYHQGSNQNHVMLYIPLSSHHRIITTSATGLGLSRMR